MENSNCNASLKRSRNFSEEIGSFKIIHTDSDVADHQSINGSKKKIISEYKIVYNETRQSNRHKTPSGVWKYFALATKHTSTAENSKDEPDDRVLCMLCYSKGRVHVYKSKTSSSNLWKHLNRKHDIEIPSEKMFTVCSSSLDRFEFACEEIDEGTSSTDYPLPALDDDNNDALIKTDDFEEIEEYQEEEPNIQPDMTIEEGEQNMETILKYDLCPPTLAVQKDIGLAIVEEVSKRPILYEVQSSKLSSVRATKEMMWVEVYEALGQIIPIERIQKIWKNIRDRYKKVRNIERDGQECLVRYKYYDHLAFLESGEQLRNQFSDVVFDESPEKKRKAFDLNSFNRNYKYSSPARTEDFSFLIEQTDGILSNVDDLVQGDQNYTTEDVVSETSSNCIVSSSDPPPTTTTIYPMEMQPNNTDDAPTKQPASPDPVPPQQPPPTTSVSNTTDQMDEFDLFGKLIANKLRSAPRDRVNLIEVKIMQAILENI